MLIVNKIYIVRGIFDIPDNFNIWSDFMKCQKYSQEYLESLLNIDMSSYKKRYSKYDEKSLIGYITDSGVEILKFVPNSTFHSEGAPVFICRCACGMLFIVKCNHILSGIVKSCGCCDNSKYASKQWLGICLNNQEIIDYYTDGLKRFFKVKCLYCGNIFAVDVYNFMKGDAVLCSCMKDLQTKYKNISSLDEDIGLYDLNLETVLSEYNIEGVNYFKVKCKFCGTERMRTKETLDKDSCECLRFRSDRCSYIENRGSRKNSIVSYMNKVGTQQGKLFIRDFVIIDNLIKKSYYICDCACGNVGIKVSAYGIVFGGVHECGKCQVAPNVKYQDKTYIGQLFTYLRVKSIYSNNGITYWVCDCEHCGKKDISIPATRVVSGNTKSCGCLISYQEYLIKNILNKYSCEFYTQWSTPELLGVGGKRLRFDFMCVSRLDGHLVAIEYDGRQHKDKSYFNMTDNEFEVIIEHDRRKDKYCKDKNIVLYRLNGVMSEDIILKIIQSEDL